MNNAKKNKKTLDTQHQQKLNAFKQEHNNKKELEQNLVLYKTQLESYKNKRLQDLPQEEIQEYKDYLIVWKKYMKIDEDMSLLTHDELLILSKYDFTDPQYLKKPKYKNPRINFLVFDDLVGDANAFKKSHSAINNLTIKHRHLQCNLMFTTQYIKAIPPTLRLDDADKIKNQ